MRELVALLASVHRRMPPPPLECWSHRFCVACLMRSFPFSGMLTVKAVLLPAESSMVFAPEPV